MAPLHSIVMGVRSGEAVQAVAFPFLNQEKLLMAKFQPYSLIELI